MLSEVQDIQIGVGNTIPPPNDTFTTVVCFCGLLAIILFIFLMIYEDGVPMNRWKKLRCWIGWHKNAIKLGKLKVHKYYCQFCKRPRKHPQMKLIDGGNKFKHNNYKH